MKYIVFLSLLISTTSLMASTTSRFASVEHMAIGDSVELRFDDYSTESHHHLPLENGLEVTYGEINTLSGDYFAIVDESISLGATDEQREERFLAAYNALAKDPKAVGEAKQYLLLFHEIEDKINRLLEMGIDPAAEISQFDKDYGGRLNRISGGGSFVSDYFPLGRVLKLASYNFDHFGKHAIIAFRTGHQLAMQQAQAAGGRLDRDGLSKAYSLNAFADHFLEDIFAAGHIRTPRYMLKKKTYPGIVGSVLSKYMHDEDNEVGVLVHNDYQTWVTYGDKYFFSKKNERTRELLKKVIQLSANEVWQAYRTGYIQAFEDSEIARLIPNIEDARIIGPQTLSAPMFYYQSKKLYRRKDLGDAQQYRWTKYWISWVTLLKMVKKKGIPTQETKAILQTYLPKSMHKRLLKAT